MTTDSTQEAVQRQQVSILTLINVPKPLKNIFSTPVFFHHTKTLLELNTDA